MKEIDIFCINIIKVPNNLSKLIRIFSLEIHKTDISWKNFFIELKSQVTLKFECE